jgi:LysM repeat protein
MASRWGLCVLTLVMVIALPACFQEAGEALQRTGTTAEPLTSLDPLPDSGDPDGADGLPGSGTQAEVEDPASSDDSAPGQPTGIPITVIADPTDPPALPQQDTATPLFPSDQVTATPAQFITPVSPLVPDAEPATPASSFTVSTPTGLVTPTSFLDTSADSVSADCLYTVRPGDNLYRIAINNGTTVEQMRNANPALTGANPVLQIGQQLRLPNCVPGASGAQVQPTQPPPPQAAVTSAPPASGSQRTYVVQRGDTLFGIASRFGTTVAAIQQANQLQNPDRLDVGQVLVIP